MSGQRRFGVTRSQPTFKRAGGLFDIVIKQRIPNGSRITDDEFYTPGEIAYLIRERLWKGYGIDLDPSSHELANTGTSGIAFSGIRAKDYFNKEENGLKRRWRAKTVFVNPPYKDWDNWTPKILKEWERQEYIEQMCVWISAHSSTNGNVFPLINACDSMLIAKGRLKHWGPKVKWDASPTDGHFLLYYGMETDRFRSVFNHIGKVFFS